MGWVCRYLWLLCRQWLEGRTEAGSWELVTTRAQTEPGEMAMEVERTRQSPRIKGGSHEH